MSHHKGPPRHKRFNASPAFLSYRREKVLKMLKNQFSTFCYCHYLFLLLKNKPKYVCSLHPLQIPQKHNI